MLLAKAVALAIAGCFVGVSNATEASSLERAAREVGAGQSMLIDSSSRPDQSGDHATDVRWWFVLGDGQLNSLVEEAEAGNRDVRASLLSVKEARALFSERRLDVLPRGNVTAGASRQRLSGPEVDPFDGRVRGPTRELAQADLAATWEIDLFGRNHARREISGGSLDIAGADLRAARALLQAEVVIAWAQWRATSQQIRLLDLEIGAAELARSTQEKRINAGIDDQRAIHIPEAWLAERRALRSDMEARHTSARSALAVLRGHSPEADNLPEPPQAPFAAPPHINALDGSRGLLIRRPDVVRAEAAYRQAQGAAALADKAFLPDFRLDFGGGVLQRPGSLDLSGAGRWAAAGIVQWDLLDWGRMRAQSRAAGAKAEAAFAALEAVILKAVKDAEDRVHEANAARLIISEAVRTSNSARRSLAATRARHSAGLEGRLALVEAELISGERDRALVDATVASVEAYAQAHLALATWQPTGDDALASR